MKLARRSVAVPATLVVFSAALAVACLLSSADSPSRGAREGSELSRGQDPARASLSARRAQDEKTAGASRMLAAAS